MTRAIGSSMPNNSSDNSEQRRTPLSFSLLCERSMSQMYCWALRVAKLGLVRTIVSRKVASVPDQFSAWRRRVNPTRLSMNSACLSLETGFAVPLEASLEGGLSWGHIVSSKINQALGLVTHAHVSHHVLIKQRHDYQVSRIARIAISVPLVMSVSCRRAQ